MSGKGSVPRPIEVPRDEYEAEYERIFGKKPSKDTSDE
jgi:hypothetical protein